MMPMTTINRKKAPPTTNKKQVPKVSEAQSKNIMESLLEDELDKIDVEDLEEATGAHLAQVREDLNKPCAFNKEEHMMAKYNVPAGAINKKTSETVTSKKRKLEEISSTPASEKKKVDVTEI